MSPHLHVAATLLAGSLGLATVDAPLSEDLRWAIAARIKEPTSANLAAIAVRPRGVAARDRQQNAGLVPSRLRGARFGNLLQGPQHVLPSGCTPAHPRDGQP